MRDVMIGERKVSWMWLNWCWRQTDGDILANVEVEASWTGNNKLFRFAASNARSLHCWKLLAA